MVNLLKSTDSYSIETDRDVETTVNIIKEGIQIDDRLFRSYFPAIFSISKPYYGVFSYPNKFIIKSRFSARPKYETEIDVIEKGKTIIEFKENNSARKFFIIIMALPFIALILYLNLDSQYTIGFLASLIILIFPVLVLLIGSLLIAFGQKMKKTYFKNLINKY